MPVNAAQCSKYIKVHEDVISLLSDIVSSWSGLAFAVRSHSPLKALISQLLSSRILLACCESWESSELTIINNSICVVEINAVIAVWKNVDIIILYTSQI